MKQHQAKIAVAEHFYRSAQRGVAACVGHGVSEAVVRKYERATRLLGARLKRMIDDTPVSAR